ncbi:3578_t:CDS:1, partial [Cetraspora pellucida]
EIRNLHRERKMQKKQENKQLLQQKEKEPLVLSLDNPYNPTNESNMNIDEQVEYITSATDEQEEDVSSNDSKMDEEPKTESLWSEEVELHSQTLSVEKQILEVNTVESNSLISRMKTPSDPLASMYSTSNQTTNSQGKDEDGFTLVSSKRKPKNRQKATDQQENSNRPKNSHGIRRSLY